jgi:hypothetical protein
MTKELKQETQLVFHKYPKLLTQVFYLSYNKDSKQKEIPLSLGDKMVWVYLVSQFDSYTKANKKFFETLEGLSEGSGVSKDTVKRFLVKLEEAEGLVVQQNKGQGFLKNNLYLSVLSVYDLAQKKGVILLNKNKQSIDLKRFTLTSNPNQKISTKTNLVKQNKQITFVSDLEEDSLPDWAK